MRHESRGTKDQLIIDQGIIKDFKERYTNIAVDWRDCYTKKTTWCHIFGQSGFASNKRVP